APRAAIVISSHLFAVLFSKLLFCACHVNWG
ncbi:MAG: hypothetical protein ACI9ZD_002960, partial [Paracoccaceae bacterium]